MESPEASHELAIRTSVAVLTGSAGMLGPEAGAAATALAPAIEVVLSRVAGRLNQRRYRHAAETLMYAADASSEPIEELVEKAISDERRHELLARALGVAQDTSLRDKRRALGRALAAGIAGDDARIDDELLFIRAIADLDEPHIRLLALLATKRAMAGDGLSGNILQGGWSPGAIAAHDPGLARHCQRLSRRLSCTVSSGPSPVRLHGSLLQGRTTSRRQGRSF